MIPQEPAQGILINKNYGTAHHYTVLCDCGDVEHHHTIWVEADEFGITVHSYVDHNTNYWEETIKMRYDIENIFLQHAYWRIMGFLNSTILKLKLTWKLWTRGSIRYQADIIMDEQTALNYSTVLQKAIQDVKEYRSL